MTTGRGSRSASDEEPAVTGGRPQDTGPHRLVLDRWISCAPYERLLNMEIVDARDGAATLSMPFLVQLAQGAALMHGGALVSLADTAMVMAIKSVLEPHTHFATVHVSADYVKPVSQGIVTASARLTDRVGRKISAGAEVSDDSGDTVLVATAKFVIARDEKILNVTFADRQS
jgi:uncharacterized protein (TIGR00369 family)